MMVRGGGGELPLQFEWFDVERDPAAWDERVRACGQNFFHTSALLAAHCNGRMRCRGVVIKRWGASVGAVGGLVKEGERGFETLSFPRPSPLLDDALPQRFVEWLQEERFRRVQLGSFDGGVEGYLDGPGRVVLKDRWEFPWDLTIAEEERHKRLSLNHRRKLKKGIGNHLLRIDRHQAFTMTRLNFSWAERRGRSHGVATLLNTYRYYTHLTRRLGHSGVGVLYGLYDLYDHPLSIAYMLECAPRCFYMIGASSPAGYGSGASVQLFWELARLYASRGFTEMNLGGVPAEARVEGHEEHGVYRFKAGFGIEPVLRKTLILEA